MQNNEQMIQALATLGLLPKDLVAERGIVEVVRSGQQLILPEGMTEDQAIEWLKRMKMENEQKVGVNEVIEEGYVLDAALAFMRALKAKYGWTGLVPTPGFFGEQPPEMIGVPIDPEGHTVEVPWGNVVIPGIVGKLRLGVAFTQRGEPCLVIGGQVQRRHLPDVKDIAKLTRDQLRKESIYQGRALRVSFDYSTDPDDFDPRVHRPTFMRRDPVWPQDLIFRRETAWSIQTSVWTMISDRAAARARGIPGKRVILLAGYYGTGKTSVAQATANLCAQNGTTFIYLERTGDLEKGVRLARQYQPAVVFAEDVDSVLSGEDRDEDTNSILNVLDGVEGKSAEVMVILSTNHPERINRALLRHGRVDDVITIEPPDAKATEALIAKYAGNDLAIGCDLTETVELMTGEIPAAIAEVVRRAKLALIPRGPEAKLESDDLMLAARSMQGHLRMLRQKVDAKPDAMATLGNVIGSHIEAAVRVADRNGYVSAAQTALASREGGPNGERVEKSA